LLAIVISQISGSTLKYLFFIVLTFLQTLVLFIDPALRGPQIKNMAKEIHSLRIKTIIHESPLTYYSLQFYSASDEKHILTGDNPLPQFTTNTIGGSQTQFTEKSQPFVTIAKDFKYKIF